MKILGKRLLTHRRRKAMKLNDEEENEQELKPSGKYCEDWTVSEHIFKMPRGEGSQVRRKWVSRTSNTRSSFWNKKYCPQVGDSVVYIPRAHFDAMQKFPNKSYVGPWKLWPTNSRWPAVCCKVAHIRYRFPCTYESCQDSCHIAAILTLNITGVPTHSGDRKYPWPSSNFVPPVASGTHSRDSSLTFEVTLFERDETEFIIPEFLYSWRIRSLEAAIYKNGGNVDGIGVTLRCAPDQCESEENVEDPDHVAYKGELKDFLWGDELEFHFDCCSGYNALSMWKWLEPLEEGFFEKIHVCSWDITLDNIEPPEVPFISKETKKELLDALNDVMLSDDKIRKWFLLQVDTRKYKDYFDVIEVPMCLSLIQSRLWNDYYTNKYSVLSDVELIKDNCYKYHQDNDEIYDSACQMYDKFKFLVDAIKTPDDEMTASNSTHDHHSGPINNQDDREPTRSHQTESCSESAEDYEMKDHHTDEGRPAEAVAGRKVWTSSKQQIIRNSRIHLVAQVAGPSSSESEEEVDEIDEEEVDEIDEEEHEEKVSLSSPTYQPTQCAKFNSGRIISSKRESDAVNDEELKRYKWMRPSPRRRYLHQKRTLMC